MGSSKKHKKHREKEREKRSHEDVESEPASADQPPLKLVLKVGSTSTTVDRSPSLHAPHAVTLPASEDEMLEMPVLVSEGEVNEFSSSKKMKKKKSKKKHRKHSHRHHHHHRHKSTCHHSKSSSHASKDHADDVATSIPMEMSEEKPPLLPEAVPPFVAPLTPAHATATMEPPVAAAVVAEPVSEAAKSPLKVPLKSGSKILYSNYLHLVVKTLQKRDSHDFFAWPVTEIIAPGYSSIIQRPMDFSTINKKIDLRIYDTIADLKADVKLICDNAMTYNGPDTIYYKAAKKLWHFAKEKVFNRDALNEMRSSVSATVLEPSLVSTPTPAPAFVQSEVATVGTETAHFPLLDPVAPETSMPSAAAAAATTAEENEDLIAKQILEQARAAAAAAADRLTLAKPQGAHYSFVRQRSDGSTSLAIVGAHPTHDRYFKLENIVGKLPEGTPYLPPYTEPEGNKVKPIESVETPPFASYLPSIDSSKSKLTPEETSLLLSAYGDEEVGIPYTKSILEFASDSNYLERMADNLLNILTQGEHAKVLQMLRQEKASAAQESPEESQSTTAIAPATELTPVAGDDITNQLQDTQGLLEDLAKIQRKRLSSTSKPTAPASEEVELASSLTAKLTRLIGSYTAPVDLTDMRSIRKAMGVQVKGD